MPEGGDAGGDSVAGMGSPAPGSLVSTPLFVGVSPAGDFPGSSEVPSADGSGRDDRSSCAPFTAGGAVAREGALLVGETFVATVGVTAVAAPPCVISSGFAALGAEPLACCRSGHRRKPASATMTRLAPAKTTARPRRDLGRGIRSVGAP